MGDVQYFIGKIRDVSGLIIHIAMAKATDWPVQGCCLASLVFVPFPMATAARLAGMDTEDMLPVGLP